MIKTTHISPIGELTLASDGEGLTALIFPDHWKKIAAIEEAKPGEDGVLTKARRQLDEYFVGKRTAFDLPLAPRGTAFQHSVWAMLRALNPGETTTYSAMAVRLDNPKAIRAVGGAVGRNPISIIVPCHRVLGADGSLRGFAGGFERKAFLLDLEKVERLAA